MPKSRRTLLFLVTALLVAGWLGRLAWWNITRQDVAGLQRYFDLPTNTRDLYLNARSHDQFESDVRAAVLARFPVGTAMGQVRSVLEAHGLGRDGRSECHPAEPAAHAGRAGDAPAGWLACTMKGGESLVCQWSYRSDFFFDAQDRLQDVKFREELLCL